MTTVRERKNIRPARAAVRVCQKAVANLKKAQERTKEINSLADKIEEFFKDFTSAENTLRATFPTYVLPLDKDGDFVEALDYEISRRSAPLHNYMYQSRMEVIGSYLNPELKVSHYNLKVDVVPRPAGKFSPSDTLLKHP